MPAPGDDEKSRGSLMRSLLFVPGDSEKKLEKGFQSGADIVIVDLEDSVAPTSKAALPANVLPHVHRAHAAAAACERRVAYVAHADLRTMRHRAACCPACRDYAILRAGCGAAAHYGQTPLGYRHRTMPLRAARPARAVAISAAVLRPVAAAPSADARARPRTVGNWPSSVA